LGTVEAADHRCGLEVERIEVGSDAALLLFLFLFLFSVSQAFLFNATNSTMLF
jgi:hypothetical protein